MKKIKNTLQNLVLILLLAISFVSCERDFTSLGSGIIGSNNFETSSATYPVITYNKPIGPVQTNTLQVNLLGFYDDPIYGSHTANIVSQMTPTAYDPVFGENVVLDSVILTIPFFSRNTNTDEDGNSTYEIDSIFGSSPIKFSVFKNNYFLRDFDPESDFSEGQKYFSNGSINQSTFINPLDLEGQLLFETEELVASAEQIILTSLDELDEPFITARLAPGIRVHLDNPNDTFWQELIFDKEGQQELSNENNFLNHFRGIYLKTEAVGPDGTMMMLSLVNSNANITLYYTSDIDSGDDGSDDEISTEPGTFVLNFSGNRVNFFNNNFITIPDSDPVNGDDRLYLKGGQGNMAIINLFNGDDEGNSPELDDFKSKNWLINEARIDFYVDQDMVDGEEPDRVYIFDLNSNRPLIDFSLDQSVSNTTTNAKIDHLKPLERVDDEPDGIGIKYRIEITEHINNLLVRDSTNIKLGLVVTTNVNSIDNANLQDEDIVSKIISGAILSPRGTVLHGNNTSDPTKKVELKIFYTEPDN